MEALVQRIEALAQSLTGPAAADDKMTPTERLAAMLKEALAANTIGGKVRRRRPLARGRRRSRQAQANWSRLGQVPDDVRAPVGGTFPARAAQHLRADGAASSGQVGSLGRVGLVGRVGQVRTLAAALQSLQQRIVEVAGRDRALLHEQQVERLR